MLLLALFRHADSSAMSCEEDAALKFMLANLAIADDDIEMNTPAWLLLP
jgi:hypothetical protein